MAVKVVGDTDGDLTLFTDFSDPIEGLDESALAELESALAQRRAAGAPRYLDPGYRAQLTWDRRTGIHVRSHHPDPAGQCAAADRGFYCTVRRGHDGWHVAWGPGREEAGSLHTWYPQER